MDLTIREFSAVPRNHDVFNNIKDLPQLTASGTVVTGACIEAAHFPNGFLRPGTLLARVAATHPTVGWRGYLAPWVPDGANGLNVIDSVVWHGFDFGGNYPGNYDTGDTTYIAGAILRLKTPVFLNIGKMPEHRLADGTTAHTFTDTATDLAGTNWQFMDADGLAI